MPGSGLSLRRAKATLADAVRRRSAVRRVDRFSTAHPARLRVCWDLDNTLVDTGSLLRQGANLGDAAAAAAPVPNMLQLFAELSGRLPGAQQVVLSARPGSLRAATHAWLRRHGPPIEEPRVFLVPSAEAKLGAWRALARGASLVIVDDLTFGHEGEELSHYEDLVEAAGAIAAAYVGHPTIAAIASGEESPAAAAAALIEALPHPLADGSGPDRPGNPL